MSLRLTSALLVAALAAAAPACKSSDLTSPPGKSGDKRPAADQPEQGVTDGPAGPGGGNAVTDDRVLDVVMRVKAKALFLTPCSGDLGIRLRLKFDKSEDRPRIIEVPVDSVKCIIYGEIGLKKMLEGDADSEAAKKCKEPPRVEKRIYEESGIVHFKELLFRTYEPGRPFLPAFISAKPEELKALDVSKPVAMTDHCNEGKKADGTVSAKTLRYAAEMRHEPMSRSFGEVYDFEFRNDGFTGMDRISAFLFDRMMMRISLKPFAVLAIELDTSAAKLVGAGDGLLGTIGNLIPVNLTGELIEMAALPPPGQSTDDGIVTEKP